jgi:hypothetical protein
MDFDPADCFSRLLVSKSKRLVEPIKRFSAYSNPFKVRACNKLEDLCRTKDLAKMDKQPRNPHSGNSCRNIPQTINIVGRGRRPIIEVIAKIMCVCVCVCVKDDVNKTHVHILHTITSEEHSQDRQRYVRKWLRDYSKSYNVVQYPAFLTSGFLY